MMETKLKSRQPAFFQLIAGNVCLDFINTLDDRPSGEPKELLKNYYDLARFGEDTRILTPEQLDYFYERVHLAPDEAEEALRRARKLRKALYGIFSALMNRQTTPQPAMDRLNANLHDAALHSRLIQPKGDQPRADQPKADRPEKGQRHGVQPETVQREGRLEWRFDDMKSSFNAMLWPITRAAGDLLASSDVALVRACSSPTCQWLFLDTSKNHHRRWCDMKVCGNRAKVRKFYARKRESAGGTG